MFKILLIMEMQLVSLINVMQVRFGVLFRTLSGIKELSSLNSDGHRHLQIGRMLDIDLLSEPPPPPQMYVSKVWESVWPEGQEAIHS
jgi:hypothetical protein